MSCGITNEEEFFSAIVEGCSNIQEKAIRILTARGFLIEKTDTGYYLSDNAASEDVEYLQLLLEKYHIGTVTGVMYREYHKRFGMIIKVVVPGTAKVEICSDTSIEKLIEAFKDIERVGFETSSERSEWEEFAFRSFGDKIPVKLLEPYVAYMVKALSACGVKTTYSCDGNHPDGAILQIKSGYPYYVWEQLLLDQVPMGGKIANLLGGIELKSNKYEMYYKIYQVAEYLYVNRQYFRNIKREATEFITRSYQHNHSKEEIEERFRNNCESLLEKRRIT